MDKERRREGEVEEGSQEERREGGRRVESYGDTRGLWRAAETFPMVWRKLIGDVWSVERRGRGAAVQQQAGRRCLLARRAASIARRCNWVVAAESRAAPRGYESMVTY